MTALLSGSHKVAYLCFDTEKYFKMSITLLTSFWLSQCVLHPHIKIDRHMFLLSLIKNIMHFSFQPQSIKWCVLNVYNL